MPKWPDSPQATHTHRQRAREERTGERGDACMTRDREHNESLAMPHNVAMSSARQQATAAGTGWTDEAERGGEREERQRGTQGRTVTATATAAAGVD